MLPQNIVFTNPEDAETSVGILARELMEVVLAHNKQGVSDADILNSCLSLWISAVCNLEKERHTLQILPLIALKLRNNLSFRFGSEIEECQGSA